MRDPGTKYTAIIETIIGGFAANAMIIGGLLLVAALCAAFCYAVAYGIFGALYLIHHV